MKLGNQQRVILEIFGVSCGISLAIGLVAALGYLAYVWTGSAALVLVVMVLGVFVEMFFVATWVDRTDAK